MTEVTSQTTRAVVELDEVAMGTWNAMHTGPGAWFEPGDWHWMSFSGEKTIDVLNGLLTNDVGALADHEVQYTAALSAKGKVLADLFVYRESATSFLTGGRMPAFASWTQVVRKFVNPRLAKYRDEQESLVTFVVAGQAARTVAPALETEQAVPTLPRETRRVNVPMFGEVAAQFIIVPRERQGEVRAQLHGALGNEGHADAFEAARIGAGWPRWGVEMDDNTLVQEANLDQLGAVSFNKGCYTGQETVARVHFRGHVNRHLRLLESAQPLPPGALVRAGDARDVGDVRSSVVIPGAGALALAMVRREVGPGDSVTVSLGGQDVAAVVRAIPYGA